jgi:uncharacterized protein YidB (DUF937 family)
MEHTAIPLSTAGDILGAYKAVCGDQETRSQAEASGLINGLARLLVTRPVGEFLWCTEKDLNRVDAMLRQAYHAACNTVEEKEAVAKGISLVGAFENAGLSDMAEAWFGRGYTV